MILFICNLLFSKILHTFVVTVPITLPIEQRTKVGLLLFIRMRYSYQTTFRLFWYSQIIKISWAYYSWWVYGYRMLESGELFRLDNYFHPMEGDKIRHIFKPNSYLDNASVHRNRKVKELRKIWEKRGLFLFYLPPYSPELNPAEILWRILKGKWIRPIDYETTDSLFYCTNMALASVGTNLFVNYSYL